LSNDWKNKDTITPFPKMTQRVMKLRRKEPIIF
jgi:hypothetical protein